MCTNKLFIKVCSSYILFTFKNTKEKINVHYFSNNKFSYYNIYVLLTLKKLRKLIIIKNI
jgi:hypothetical protein